LSKSLVRRGRPTLPTEDLFVYVYVLIHDLMLAGLITVPPRPGPVAAAQGARGAAVLVRPGKSQRASMPPVLLKVIAQWRNRIETTFSEITDRMELARHGAHTFWGLLTRTSATIAAHTLLPRRKSTHKTRLRLA
jgi:hypothetical protein